MSPIPWTTILTHGPALVGAAKRLLAASGKSPETNHTIEARLARLEKASMESARLLDDIAEQVQALAIVQVQTARRARIGVTLGIAAIAIAIGAGILAVIW